ncbi:chemotaxis protein CheB [Gloeothece verrucosa]|uniref:protein-glutamate methylesterase n=1 Tax=Gloeothece verrucosa (strain PCC 7822) TaxID=497965 RepID=E0UB89_GLOV7|nr:chemotaxis protein CheB [Gloeothece verrucosa]ADN17445.1 CheB methylesterase [Gloeothece verrucosa PCC 7822]
MNNLKPDQEQNEPLKLAKTNFDLIALAASAGGIKALSEVISQLPADFPVAVIVLQHLDRHYRSFLPEILKRRTHLPVKQAEEGELLQPGYIYIAPSNYHLLVNPDGKLSLNQAALVHFVRPSADVLFNSIATNYQTRAIAVVLTGTGQDGSLGVQTIKNMGGIVIAQDQETSEFFGMPKAAIATGKVDFVLPLSKISEMLISLVMQKPKNIK